MSWDIWIGDPFGTRLMSASPVSFVVAKVANKPGAFSMLFTGNFDVNPIRLDGLVEFWRDGKWVNTGMARAIRYFADKAGNDYVQISGPDLQDILDRRIIIGAAGSAESDKTDYADDMIKAIVTEQFGSGAGAGRDISAYLTVEADKSLGYSLSKSFAYKNVLTTIQEIAQTSTENSLPIYFDVVPYISGNNILFRFETYLNQPGIDRTGTSQVVFGTNYDNISDVNLEYDFTSEVTAAYAGGQGEGADRYLTSAINTDRVAESPYNRRESFKDARNESSTTAADDKASQSVREGAPVVRFAGRLLDIPPTRYGIEWSWGDKVIVQYRDIQQEAIISAVTFTVNDAGRETIDARFALEDSATYSGRLVIEARKTGGGRFDTP